MSDKNQKPPTLSRGVVLQNYDIGEEKSDIRPWSAKADHSGYIALYTN